MSFQTDLVYDPGIGHILWAKSGKRAGTLADDGYRHLRYRNRYYREHRVAWLLFHGAWPSDGKDIDHVNGVRDDNRICNLREATRSENIANSRVRSDAKSGLKGVRSNGYGWVARVQKDGKRHYLGTFKTPDEAAAAYSKAMQEKFGAFGRAA